MAPETAVAAHVVARLRRVEEKIGGIIRTPAEDRDGASRHRLAAASRARDRGRVRLLAAGMTQSRAATAAGGAEPMSGAELEQILPSFAWSTARHRRH